MKCHFCDRKAVDRCYQCGELFCEEHGTVNCSACTSGIAEGAPRRDEVSTIRMTAGGHGNAWWRPVAAEEYVPPACHQCGGLARNLCVGCGRRYCPSHAGKGGRCAECQASSAAAMRIGFAVIAAIGLLFAASLLLSWLRG